MNDELHHHGILGMKWGIRRYQNADGTLTKAGKDRYLDVRYDAKLNKKDTKDALSITKKEYKKNYRLSDSSKKKELREEKKTAKSIEKYEKASSEGNTKKANKYQENTNKHFVKALENAKKGEEFLKKGDLYKQKHESILKGDLEAGKNFIVQRDYNLYPIAIPTPNGALVSVVISKEKRLIENQSKER